MTREEFAQMKARVQQAQRDQMFETAGAFPAIQQKKAQEHQQTLKVLEESDNLVADK